MYFPSQLRVSFQDGKDGKNLLTMALASQIARLAAIVKKINTSYN